MYGGTQMEKKSLLIITLFCVTSFLVAQPTFGPYTSDDNTVILMHFDADVSNGGNGGAATTTGSVSFNDAGKHGNAAYFDNSAYDVNDSTIAANDTSYLTLADHDNLDITESWTIEFWAKSKSRNDWSNGPEIVSKVDTVSTSFWWNGGTLSNYAVRLNGNNADSRWRDIDSTLRRDLNVGDVALIDTNSMEYPWVHVTYIHDFDSRFEGIFAHDVDGNLLGHSYTRFHCGTSYLEDRWYQHSPTSGGHAMTNGLPLYIGMNADNGKTFDGWLDELRVSNVVRGFANAPPLAEHGWNNGQDGTLGKHNPRTGSGTHTVGIDVMQFNASGTYSITGVDLLYNTRTNLDEQWAPDNTGWTTVAMTGPTDVHWTGSFPIGDRGTWHEYYFKITDADGNVHDYGTSAEGDSWDNDDFQVQNDSTYYTVVVVDDNSLVLDMDFETFEDDDDPADNSVYGWNVDVYGDYALGDEVPDADFGMQESETSYEWLDGVPSYIEIRDGQALHSDEFTHSVYFNLGHNSEGLVNHDLILMSTQSGGRYNQDGSAFWLDNYAIQVMDDGAGGSKVWNYSTLIGDLSWAWCYELAQEQVFHYSIQPHEWWHMVVAMDFDHEASTGTFYSLIVNEDMEQVGTFHAEEQHIPAATFDGLWRLGTRGGPDAHGWPVGYADNIKVWNYAITPDNDPDGIYHGLMPGTVSTDDESILNPDVFELTQNYPNPFNPTTTFDLTISVSQNVDFAIYNIVGQRVKTLVARTMPAGVYNISWDGRTMEGLEAASGLYIAKAIGDDFNFQKKITLLR